MLKDSEIKNFMDEIDLINKYIKENPSELIYAQQRYPKDDPRLAQLNWQMDQMLDASKEYTDKHFPENKKLFKKIQKSIGKNIELTDPKSFKGVKVPKFKGVDLTDFKRRKEVVARHYKKAVKTKKLFSRKKT
jgi:predicted acylesterase/phospholipase RssA